jgi:hypothetical protein
MRGASNRHFAYVCAARTPIDGCARRYNGAGWGLTAPREATMLMHRTHYRILSRRERLAIAAAALTASGSLVCSLILVFDDASPSTWIAPTQEVVESLDHCDHLAARDAREQCKRALAAAKLNTLNRPTQTAGGEPARQR